MRGLANSLVGGLDPAVTLEAAISYEKLIGVERQSSFPDIAKSTDVRHSTPEFQGEVADHKDVRSCDPTAQAPAHQNTVNVGPHEQSPGNQSADYHAYQADALRIFWRRLMVLQHRKEDDATDDSVHCIPPEESPARFGQKFIEFPQ